MMAIKDIAARAILIFRNISVKRLDSVLVFPHIGQSAASLQEY